MRALRRLEQSLSSRCERLIVTGLCRVRGVRWAIRYLRNPDPKATGPLLRHFGAQVGPGTTFKRTLWLDNVYEDQDAAGDFSHLHFGANCYVGDGVYFDARSPYALVSAGPGATRVLMIQAGEPSTSS